MNNFTGIGSRETPNDILKILHDASAYYCGQQDYILRSGGADGADTSCERGCDSVDGLKEIYLPWPYFNGNRSELFELSLPNWKEAYDIAASVHPKWDQLNQAVRKLHTRNVYQVLGKDLDTPSDFVLCYAKLKKGLPQGGTAQAIRVAEMFHVPIINLAIFGNQLTIQKLVL
jgi:hypothetical protein